MSAGGIVPTQIAARRQSILSMSFFSRAKKFSRELVPPIVHRLLGTRRADLNAALDAFYGVAVPRGGLCFDVGANEGERVASFRRLGLRVVAVEPQPKCFANLRSAFGNDSEVTLVNKALGSVPGQATMMLSDTNVVSTMSASFIEATTRSGRFGGAKWDKSTTVEVSTLDALIAQHGVPDFIKIDVEGYEAEVVRGLSRPIGLVALEWVPELTDLMIECINHLAGLGPIECNLSWGESMRYSRREWLGKEKLIYTLDQFRDETFLFGDVYIRSTAAN